MTNLKKLRELLIANDESTHYEINARAHCYFTGSEFESVDGHWYWHNCGGVRISRHVMSIPDYATCITSQAAIMPEGWNIKVSCIGDSWKVSLVNVVAHSSVRSGWRPTEVLARLLAIVEVWIWKEENE